RLRITSCPIAFSWTFSVNSLTTFRLTSASSSAVRTSRIASRMFSSLIRPRPERLRNTPLNFSLSVSSMGYPVIGRVQTEGDYARRRGVLELVGQAVKGRARFLPIGVGKTD